MKQLTDLFPQAQFIEVEEHKIPLNLSKPDDLGQPIKACFPFPKGVIAVSGADSVTFLQGLCTIDVKKLEQGKGARGLFVNKLGKILFDVFFYLDGETIYLITDPSEEKNLFKHLDFYLITEAVKLEFITDWNFYYLLEEEGQGETPAGLSQIWSISKEQGQITVVACKKEENQFKQLVEAGFKMIGFELYEELRPAFELSRAGIDFDGERIPQEAALESAVAFDKGCYLGQEPISRVAFRGKEKHKLVCFKSLNPVPSGLPIVADSKEVGIVTSGSSVKVRGSFYSLGYLESDWISDKAHPLYCTTAELIVDREKDQ